jgi:peroxiredoxin
VARIVCGTVNDHHVTRAWAERSNALGRVDFIADVHAALADAFGLVRRTDNLGKRFSRFAMIIEDGVVERLYIQDEAGVTVSGAPAILLALETLDTVAVKERA